MSYSLLPLLRLSFLYNAMPNCLKQHFKHFKNAAKAALIDCIKVLNIHLLRHRFLVK
jgi:hypothetical protein